MKKDFTNLDADLFSATNIENVAYFRQNIEALEIVWTEKMPDASHERNVHRKLERVTVDRLIRAVGSIEQLSADDFILKTKSFLEQRCRPKTLPDDCRLLLIMADNFRGW